MSKALAWVGLGITLGGTACSAEPHSKPPEVVIGMPSGTDGLEFSGLSEGASLDVETFGQGGSHVAVAVRAIGLGSQAFVHVTIEDLETGSSVERAPGTRADLLSCHGTSACDLLPIYVMLGGLTATPEERDGLEILISAEVESETGTAAEASVRAVLRQPE